MVRFEDGLNFQWPHTDLDFPNQQPVTDSTADAVVKTIKGIVHSFGNKTDITTEPTLKENFTSNSTVVDGVTEMIGSNNTGITEMIGSNNIGITEMVGSNNTGIIEMMGSNNTVMDFNNTGMNEIFGNNTTEDSGIKVTDVVTTVVDSVVTTTETAFNTISNVVTTKTTLETTTEDFYHLENHGEETEEITLYIVVGVILVIMLLLIVILLIIYRRYKTRSTFRSGVYCVTDLNEISSSSCNQKEVPVQQRVAKYP